METTDGQKREMKYCDCKKPKKNGGDNYCRICDGLIANLLELPVILQRTDIENIAQMVCDPENQPHQYMGDIDGFTELIKEKIAKNCLADFNDAMIDIIPEDFDGKKVNEIYDRLLSALSK